MKKTPLLFKKWTPVIFCCTSLLLINHTASAQGIGINPTGANPHNSAMLDIASDSSGLLIPRLQLGLAGIPKNAPATHLFGVNTRSVFNAGSRFNSGLGLYRYDGTRWNRLLESTDSTLFWGTRGNAGTNPATDFIGTTDNTNFVIRVGSGTMATRRRITIPFAVSTGDIVVENVRAMQLPTGSFSNPSFRFQGMSTGDGFSSPSSTSIAITYNASSVASKYFFTLPGIVVNV